MGSVNTQKPSYKPATINDVKVIELRGPWNSKSGGELSVLFAIPFDVLQEQYFNYKQEELDAIPADIRGLRAYAVRKIPKGSIGANEWHRVRNELVFALGGDVRWTCEDVYGARKEFVLNSGTGIWNPPYVLHTYQAESEGVGVLVIANTLFDPDNPATHDSNSAESFKELQALYR